MKNYTPTKTENAYIIGRPTGHLFDFIYTVENKTEKPLTLNFCDDGIEPIHLPPLEWVGLEFDDAGVAATYSIEIASRQRCCKRGRDFDVLGRMGDHLRRF